MAVKIIKTQIHSAQIDHNDLANVGVNTHQQLDEIVDEVKSARDNKNTLDQRIDEDINNLQIQIDDVGLEIQQARGGKNRLDERLDDLQLYIDEFNEDITVVSDNITTLNEDLDNAQAQIEAINIEITEARGNNVNLGERFDNIETELSNKYEKPANGIPASDLDPTIMESIAHWKSPVSTFGSLPTVDNADGDARVVLEDGSIYIWVNNAWKQISGGGSDSGSVGDLYVGTNVTVEYQYDSDNKLIKEITTGDINRVKDYTYDDDGNITQIIMVEDGQTYTQTFEYNNGNISKIVNNGVDLFLKSAESGYIKSAIYTDGITKDDWRIMQINLMKTNFKVDSLANATRNSMQNMIIDVFNDIAGIDAAQSDYIFDSVQKTVGGAIVITTPEIISSPPTTALLSVDYTGNIDFYISCDGINWMVIYNNIICDISNQPFNNLLQVKFIMQADAELSAYALAWR